MKSQRSRSWRGSLNPAVRDTSYHTKDLRHCLVLNVIPVEVPEQGVMCMVTHFSMWIWHSMDHWGPEERLRNAKRIQRPPKDPCYGAAVGKERKVEDHGSVKHESQQWLPWSVHSPHQGGALRVEPGGIGKRSCVGRHWGRNTFSGDTGHWWPCRWPGLRTEAGVSWG